jgi:hypothetical protein
MDFIYLSLQSNPGSPEPLLMTPQEALLSLSPPTSGHKPRSVRHLALAPFLMLAQEACSSSACGRVSSGPTARLRREEYRLRLKQTTPDAAHRYPPTSEVLRQVEEGEEFRFMRALI